jgi:hypothetical protein
VFVILLVLLLLGAAIHYRYSAERSRRRGAELTMVYLLVGYCGLPMVAVAVWLLVSPEKAATGLGFAPGGAFQQFFSFAYLGISLIAVLAIWYRGAFLIGPAVAWSVYWAGATIVHFLEAAGQGTLRWKLVLLLFATHGLIAVLLMTALVLSGLLRRQGRT